MNMDVFPFINFFLNFILQCFMDFNAEVSQTSV